MHHREKFAWRKEPSLSQNSVVAISQRTHDKQHGHTTVNVASLKAHRIGRFIAWGNDFHRTAWQLTICLLFVLIFLFCDFEIPTNRTANIRKSSGVLQIFSALFKLINGFSCRSALLLFGRLSRQPYVLLHQLSVGLSKLLPRLSAAVVLLFPAVSFALHQPGPDGLPLKACGT